MARTRGVLVDLLRSMLAMAPTDEARVREALSYGADAVILDLETVEPAGRERAREAARAALPGLQHEHVQRWVRVNPSHEQLAKPDIRAVVSAELTGIILPRATSRNHVLYIEALLRDAEQMNGVKDGETKLIPTVESAAGLLECKEIVRASRRIVALHFGAGEYCEDLGVARTKGGHELQFARSQIALCARVAGVMAIDTAFTEELDDVGLRADAEVARTVGFHGKVAIDPAQVPVLNDLFRPTPEVVEYARRVMEAHEAAEAGLPPTIDGRVIDSARAARARRIIDLVTAIEAREAQSAI
jgi:citrate lyase subunit beta / citryl-CoA lyase